MDPLKNIEVIVFDAFGTLLNIASIDERLKHHFGDRAAEVAGIWRQKQLEYTWLRSLMERYENFTKVTADALQFACNQLNIELDEIVLVDLMNHYDALKVYPEVPQALALLNQKFKLGILSNANQTLLENNVAFNNIGPYLETVLSVDQIQRYKPIPKVYELPVNFFSTSKERVAFVSSNTWDVAGAASVGLKVIWANRKGGVPEQLGFAPDIVVTDLLELAQLVS